jgi:hypothetical protein
MKINPLILLSIFSMTTAIKNPYFFRNRLSSGKKDESLVKAYEKLAAERNILEEMDVTGNNLQKLKSINKREAALDGLTMFLEKENADMEEIIMRVLLITLEPLHDIVKKRKNISDKFLLSNVETLSQDDIDINLKEMKSLDMDVNKIYTSLQKYLVISIPTEIQNYYDDKISKINKKREILLEYLERIKNQTNKEEYIKEYNKYLEISKSLDKALENLVNVCISGIGRMYEILFEPSKK